MEELEYNEFFYTEEPKRTVVFSQALDWYEEDLIEPYKSHQYTDIYCPDCKVCQLKFTRKSENRRAYLSRRTYRNNPEENQHAESCIHLLPLISMKHVNIPDEIDQ